MIGKWGFSLLPFYLGIIPIFANNNYTLTNIQIDHSPQLSLYAYIQLGRMPYTLPHISEYYVLNNYSPSPFTHSWTSASSTPDRNLCPSCQSPVPAMSARSCPLSPNPEDAEVANGITVLPVKSLFSTKESTGHAAMPHQIGY